MTSALRKANTAVRWNRVTKHALRAVRSASWSHTTRVRRASWSHAARVRRASSSHAAHAIES
eukprot:666752-Pleurochrysis_carterae.AAC.1